MTYTPDEPLERAPRAADEVSGPRVPCRQSERAVPRSLEPRARDVSSEQEKFVTEWYCYPEDEGAENRPRSPDKRSQ